MTTVVRRRARHSLLGPVLRGTVAGRRFTGPCVVSSFASPFLLMEWVLIREEDVGSG